MENNIEERNDSTVLYKFKNITAGGTTSNSSGAESGGNVSGDNDILNACEEVAKMLMDRGCRYSKNVGTELIPNDIEKQLKEGKYFCCATYTTAVLYHAGVLKADQINSFRYHYTGSGGIPDMLEAAGWKKVSSSDAQPGDVLNVPEEHVMIYAGNNQVWDETAAVISDSGAPTGAPYTTSRPIESCQVWRKP